MLKQESLAMKGIKPELSSKTSDARCNDTKVRYYISNKGKGKKEVNSYDKSKENEEINKSSHSSTWRSSSTTVQSKRKTYVSTSVGLGCSSSAEKENSGTDGDMDWSEPMNICNLNSDPVERLQRFFSTEEENSDTDSDIDVSESMNKSNLDSDPIEGIRHFPSAEKETSDTESDIDKLESLKSIDSDQLSFLSIEKESSDTDIGIDQLESLKSTDSYPLEEIKPFSSTEKENSDSDFSDIGGSESSNRFNCENQGKNSARRLNVASTKKRVLEENATHTIHKHGDGNMNRSGEHSDLNINAREETIQSEHEGETDESADKDELDVSDNVYFNPCQNHEKNILTTLDISTRPITQKKYICSHCRSEFQVEIKVKEIHGSSKNNNKTDNVNTIKRRRK